MVFALVLAVAGCGGGGPSHLHHTAGKALESVTIKQVSAPVERKLDGVIEAVNQGPSLHNHRAGYPPFCTT